MLPQHRFRDFIRHTWGGWSHPRRIVTKVYCGHEYTQANAKFAVSVDPDNPALRAAAERIGGLRARGERTIPSELGEEKAANPFLRADDPEMQRLVGMVGAEPSAVFAEIRRRKDTF